MVHKTTCVPRITRSDAVLSIRLRPSNARCPATRSRSWKADTSQAPWASSFTSLSFILRLLTKAVIILLFTELTTFKWHSVTVLPKLSSSASCREGNSSRRTASESLLCWWSLTRQSTRAHCRSLTAAFVSSMTWMACLIARTSGSLFTSSGRVYLPAVAPTRFGFPSTSIRIASPSGKLWPISNFSATASIAWFVTQVTTATVFFRSLLARMWKMVVLLPVPGGPWITSTRFFKCLTAFSCLVLTISTSVRRSRQAGYWPRAWRPGASTASSNAGTGAGLL
mmetsp:Transcript_30963/g.66604  ORF Transcript_30963/g.66604 Transcript_30963/m.66604 type:complete len:282 (+) Transcript_30963:1504-2349(+)